MRRKFLLKRDFKLLSILVLFFCIHIIISCSFKKQYFTKAKRFAVVQTVDWFVKEDTLKSYIISDTNYIFDEQTVEGLRIAQFQIQNSEYNPSTSLSSKYIPTTLAYFIYEKTDSVGLYYINSSINSGRVLKVDSVMGNKIDKYKTFDTLSIINKNVFFKYFNKKNEVVFSYPHNNQLNKTHDYDSIRLIYTSNLNLKNELLSKKLSTYENYVLYKVNFYFNKGFDEEANYVIPERNIEIEIMASDDFNENEVKGIIEKFKKAIKLNK